jgi:hypothetical protein
MAMPLAVQLYRRYLNGESVEELSRELRLPARCIRTRLQAAAAYVSSQNSRSTANTPVHINSYLRKIRFDTDPSDGRAAQRRHPSC